jgi:predicted transcriptional regulator
VKTLAGCLVVLLLLSQLILGAFGGFDASAEGTSDGSRDWNQFLHDAQNTNYIDAEPMQSANYLWNASLPPNPAQMIPCMGRTTPLIVGNRVYAITHSDMSGPCTDLVALDLQTGALEWNVSLRTYPPQGNWVMVADDNFIFVPEEGHSFAAYNRTNGDLAWWTHNDTAFWLVGTDRGILTLSLTGINVFDAVTGNLKSYRPFVAPFPIPPNKYPEYFSVYGDNLYVRANDVLYSIFLDNGSIQWRIDSGTCLLLQIIVLEHYLIIGTCGDNLTVLQRSDGKEIWTKEGWGGGHRISQLVSTDGTTVFSYKNTSFVEAIDIATGTLKWSKNIECDALTVVHDTVFLEYENWTTLSNFLGIIWNDFWALNKDTGDVKWHTQINLLRGNPGSIYQTVPSQPIFGMSAADGILVLEGYDLIALGKPPENHPPNIVANRPSWPPSKVSGTIRIEGNATDPDYGDYVARVDLQLYTVKDSTVLDQTGYDCGPGQKACVFTMVIDTTKLKDLDFQKDDNFYIVTIIAKDNHGLSRGIDVNFTVDNSGTQPPVNHPPIITSMPSTTAWVDTLYKYGLDVIDEDNDNLTFGYGLVITDKLDCGLPDIQETWLVNVSFTVIAIKAILSFTPVRPGTYLVCVYVNDSRVTTIQKWNLTVSGVPPGLAILFPTDTSLVSGAITIRIQGWSHGIPLKIKIDDGQFEAVNYTGANYVYTHEWDTRTVANGVHKIICDQTVSGGILVQQTSIIVVVLNPPPALAVGLPHGPSGSLTSKAKEPVSFQPPVIPGFEPTSYNWDFGDGDNSTDMAPKHTYQNNGTYTVHLVIMNKTGSFSFEEKLTITEPAKKPTTAIAGSTPFFAISVLLVVIVGLVAVANTEAAMCWFMPALLLLYSRLRKVEVLDNYTRGRLMGYLQSNPGVNYNLIRDELGLNNGTLTYHLQVMEREGYIRSERSGLHKRFYPLNAKKEDRIRLDEQVLATLRKNPGISQKDLAFRLGQSPSTIHRVLHKLNGAGMVEFKRDGKVTHCYLSPEEEDNMQNSGA